MTARPTWQQSTACCETCGAIAVSPSPEDWQRHLESRRCTETADRNVIIERLGWFVVGNFAARRILSAARRILAFDHAVVYYYDSVDIFDESSRIEEVWAPRWVETVAGPTVPDDLIEALLRVGTTVPALHKVISATAWGATRESQDINILRYAARGEDAAQKVVALFDLVDGDKAVVQAALEIEGP